MQILQGTLLRPVSATDCRVTPNAVVRIGDDGKIAEVTTSREPIDGAMGGAGAWILPGFIDAHLHVPQWDRRGIDGFTLSQWHEQVGRPAEARCADPKVAEELAEQFCAGMIANGTTTAVCMGSPFYEATDRTLEVFNRRGLRAIHGMILGDMNSPAELAQSPDKALDESRRLAAKWHGAAGGRLYYAFSPRSTVRCSEAMMRGAAALATMLKCYIHTHASESLEELSAVRERYPEEVDEIDVFADMGLLSPRTILAHGVFLNHQQRRQVAQTHTALVHCPTANLFRESGLMDYVAHRAAGIRIALGSSIAGGPDPFMPRVAAEGLHTAKAIKVHSLPRRAGVVPSPAEAWWVLTRGAAEALGLADRIGAIESGYEADCLVVRPEKWLAGLPVEQQISSLLYTISPQQIERVFIGGRQVG